MAATSPYQNNDYQAVSTFRPYNLPINDIFKSISAQNAFWDEGAARVKNVYENALNLKLSLEPNKEIRDNFMKEAEKQITKLSTMDLSDPSVQRQGFAIFKPLFKDEGIVSDDAATRHIEKVNNDALAFRTKEHGKFYNYYNHEYALSGSKEFKNSKDRMAGKTFLQQAKEYEPYYDYTDDFTKALKDCTPSSLVRQSPMYNGEKNDQITGYMNFSSWKGLSAQQARVCIEGGMSSAGLRQLQIEGAVSYRNNKGALASDTVSYLSSVNDNSSAELQQLAANRTAIRESKTLTETEKQAAIQALDEKMKGISNDIIKNNNITNKLNAGDMSPIDEDMDAYAGSVYTYRKLYKRAVAAYFSEDEQKIIADPVQLQIQKFNNDLYLDTIDKNFQIDMKTAEFDHDREMKLLDLMYDGKDSKSSPAAVYRNPKTRLIEINPNIQQEQLNFNQKPEPDDKAYAILQENVAAMNKAESDNNTKLYHEVLTKAEKDPKFKSDLLKGFNYEDNEKGWQDFQNRSRNNRFSRPDEKEVIPLHETAWFKAYFPLNKEDQTFNTWAHEASNIQVGLQILNRKIELAERQVLDELGYTDIKSSTELTEKKIKEIPSVNVYGIYITPQDIQNSIEGKSKKLEFSYPNITGERPRGNPGRVSIKLNGNSLDYTSSDYKTLEKLYNKVNDINVEINNQLSTKRAEVYSTLGFNRDRFFFTPDDKSWLPTQIQSKFPDVKGIAVQSSDFSGGVKINHPGVTEKDLDVYRTEVGIGTTAEIGKDGTVILRNTNYNVVPQAINNPVMKNIAFQLSTIAVTRDFLNTPPGARVKNADIKVPVYISGKRQIASIETYNSGSGPEYRVYVEGANTTEPQARSNNSYDLLEQISRLPIDFNKK